MAKKVQTQKFVLFCIFVFNRKAVLFYRHYSYIERCNQLKYEAKYQIL